jgi:hypothetical protein
LASAAQAQHLRELDFQSLYAKSNVSVQEVYTFSCENNLPVESCLLSRYEYDEYGRVTLAVDFFACGRVFAEQHFEYDESGKLTRNTLQHAFNGMEEVEVTLVQDDRGHVVERMLENHIPNYWMVERMERNEAGHVLSVHHFRKLSSGTQQFWENHFLPLEAEMERRSNNTMTDIFDASGLQLLHHSFTQRGLEHITKHVYEFRDS